MFNFGELTAYEMKSLLFMLLVSSYIATGQERTRYDAMVAKLMNAYNTANLEEVCKLFGPHGAGCADGCIRDWAQAVILDWKDSLGAMVSFDYLRIDAIPDWDTVAVFKVDYTLRKDTELMFSLDRTNHFERFMLVNWDIQKPQLLKALQQNKK